MAYRLIFSPSVFEDIQDAVSWYNSKQKGLGKRFFTAVKTHYKLLKNDPYCISVKYDNIRCLPISKFPYTIHYQIIANSEEVVVFAIYHDSRNPSIWKERITPE